MKKLFLLAASFMLTLALFDRYVIVSSNGSVLQNGEFTGPIFKMHTDELASGEYLLILQGTQGSMVKPFVK